MLRRASGTVEPGHGGSPVLRFAICQGTLATATLVLQAVASGEAARMTGSVVLAGAPVTAQLAGAVVSLVVVAQRSPRDRSTPRLVAVGLWAAACGVLTTVIAITLASLWGLLVGAVVFGAGTSLATLLRGFVASTASPSRRGRAVARVAIGGIAGGLVAPLLLASRAGIPAGFGRLLPLIAVAIGLVACALSIRSVGRQRPATAPRDGVPPDATGNPRIAVVVSVVAGVAMVAAMSAGMAQLGRNLIDDQVIALVIAAHYAGMFGAPLVVGTVADRYGRRRALVLSLGFLAAGGAGMVAGAGGPVTFAVLLALIGAGWGGAFVTATAVISDGHCGSGVGAIAVNDLVVAVASALAGLSGTALLAGGGIGTVGAAILTLAALGAVVTPRLANPVHGRQGLRPGSGSEFQGVSPTLGG